MSCRKLKRSDTRLLYKKDKGKGEGGDKKGEVQDQVSFPAK